MLINNPLTMANGINNAHLDMDFQRNGLIENWYQKVEAYLDDTRVAELSKQKFKNDEAQKTILTKSAEIVVNRALSEIFKRKPKIFLKGFQPLESNTSSIGSFLHATSSQSWLNPSYIFKRRLGQQLLRAHPGRKFDDVLVTEMAKIRWKYMSRAERQPFYDESNRIRKQFCLRTSRNRALNKMK